MPRQARLDVPGALHHVMARGIERRMIFAGQEGHADFLARVGKLVEDGSLLVYAWALMPNHFHLLVRSTKVPLSQAMRKLMSGYAGWFNRHNRRVGHVFQNRFKSVLCQEEPYFLELVRYIHLNPLRAGLVKSLGELNRSPITGHSALIGKALHPWQDTEAVLSRFSQSKGKSVAGYIQFIQEGLKKPVPKHLEGGGLVRSHGGWSAVFDLRRGREGYSSDERVLGGSEFVEGLLKEAEKEAGERTVLVRKWDLRRLMGAVCENAGVSEDLLGGRGKIREVARAREGICYLWVRKIGGSGGELARVSGMKPATVYSAAVRGQKNAQEWEDFLRTA